MFNLTYRTNNNCHVLYAERYLSMFFYASNFPYIFRSLKFKNLYSTRLETSPLHTSVHEKKCENCATINHIITLIAILPYV